MLSEGCAAAILKSAQGEPLTAQEKVLVEEAKNYVSTPEEAEEHRRSFAYGNAALSNPAITREMVDQVADELAREREEKILPFTKK